MLTCSGVFKGFEDWYKKTWCRILAFWEELAAADCTVPKLGLWFEICWIECGTCYSCRFSRPSDTSFFMNSNTLSFNDIFMGTISKTLFLTSLHVYLLIQHEQYNHLWVSRSKAMTPPSLWTPSQSPPRRPALGNGILPKKTSPGSLFFTSLHVYLDSQLEQYNHFLVSRSKARKPPSS